MKRFVLDTNIALTYVRENQLYKKVEDENDLTNPENIVMISVATLGELLSLGKQNNWGHKKMQQLENLLREIPVIDINSSDKNLVEAYAEIDAYSKGRLEGNPLHSSSRNMGKNDLWIAATAKVADATLITTDGDFDHLHNQCIQVIKYTP